MIPPLYVDPERAPEVVALSRTAIDRLEAKGEFPRRRQLSARRVAYLYRELVEWAESRPVSELLPVPKGQDDGA